MNIHTSAHSLPWQEKSPCEDAVLVRERDETIIAVLADGVGSAAEGGTAAHRAVTILTDYYLTRPQAWSPRRALSEFATQINRLFLQESLQTHGTPELLCTLTVVAIEGDRLYGLNLGDSPAFIFQNGQLRELTQRHTLNQPGLEHVVTQALGSAPEIEPHLFETQISDGDQILLLSDGVTNALSLPELTQLLIRRAPAVTYTDTARERAEKNPELLDDTSAIVIDITQRSWKSASAKRAVEVLPTLRAGDAIDTYKLSRPLAQNDRVWLAHSSDQQAVVLKFPPTEAADDETRRDAFVREVWQATRIKSPDFIHARQPLEGTLRYYVMDYIEAPTLDQRLRIGPLSVDDAILLGRFLLRASQHLVAHDIAHGDIKPENILILPPDATCATHRYLMLDLGSAAPLFSVNTRAGTPSYLAPERFRQQPLSEHTEIYSIGVTLYQALTRTYPYGEVERFQTPNFERTPKRPSQLNSALPLWLETIILRTIAPDPRQRYQHLSEVAYDLENPAQVIPFFAKDASLLERNPVLLYKTLSALLALLSLFLLYKLSQRN